LFSMAMGVALKSPGLYSAYRSLPGSWLLAFL
jgi:hypothetical protein